MKTYLLPAVTAVLCLISWWLMVHDIDVHGLGKEDAAKPSKRLIVIYAVVMILLTEGAAVMFLLVYKDVSIWTALKRLTLLSVIWPIALIDLKSYRIPNAFIIYGLVCRAVLLLLELLFGEIGVWQTLLTEVVAAAALLIAALLCSLLIKNSIGFGDIKLFVIMGMLLGTDAIWGAIFLSLLVSFVIAAVALITKRKTRKDVIPFGPALVIGTFLSVYLTGM